MKQRKAIQSSPTTGVVPPMPATAREARAHKKAADVARAAQERWEKSMQSASVSAQQAWDSGRTHHTLISRLEYADGSPPDDVAGMLQVVTRVGWELIGTDLTSAVRLVIPGGIIGWGGVGVLGKDRYASDLIAVYTFARSGQDRPS